MTRPWLLALALASSACASRNYTYYLLEPAPEVNAVLEEPEGTQLRPFAFGSTTSMKVAWNDGNMLTELEIPMLATGQRIVIEHAPGATGVQTVPASRLVPPPPVAADRALDEAYRQRGLSVNPEAGEVSLSLGLARAQQASAAGNHALALDWVELVLARYPSHPETLRAKGSLLLLMGEREKAIEVYETVEEIESDPSVRQTLDELQREAR